MTPAELISSAISDAKPPIHLCPAAKALWYAKKGSWDEAHDIAQDIESPLGSWIHALLHLVEGDIGNASYWFAKAGRPVKSRVQADELWAEIAAVALRES